MKLQELLMGFLKNKGFLPKIDTDGDIVFPYEGKIYLISIDSRDSQYFRLILPNFWDIDNDDEMKKGLKVANDVNCSIKVANVIIVRRRVWAVAEMFIDGTPEPEDFFLRTLGVVKEAADRFSRGMLGGDKFDILAQLLK